MAGICWISTLPAGLMDKMTSSHGRYSIDRCSCVPQKMLMNVPCHPAVVIVHSPVSLLVGCRTGARLLLLVPTRCAARRTLTTAVQIDAMAPYDADLIAS
jgi:hypothetical protein